MIYYPAVGENLGNLIQNNSMNESTGSIFDDLTGINEDFDIATENIKFCAEVAYNEIIMHGMLEEVFSQEETYVLNEAEEEKQKFSLAKFLKAIWTRVSEFFKKFIEKVSLFVKKAYIKFSTLKNVGSIAKSSISVLNTIRKHKGMKLGDLVKDFKNQNNMDVDDNDYYKKTYENSKNGAELMYYAEQFIKSKIKYIRKDYLQIGYIPAPYLYLSLDDGYYDNYKSVKEKCIESSHAILNAIKLNSDFKSDLELELKRFGYFGSDYDAYSASAANGVIKILNNYKSYCKNDDKKEITINSISDLLSYIEENMDNIGDFTLLEKTIKEVNKNKKEIDKYIKSLDKIGDKQTIGKVTIYNDEKKFLQKYSIFLTGYLSILGKLFSIKISESFEAVKELKQIASVCKALKNDLKKNFNIKFDATADQLDNFMQALSV